MCRNVARGSALLTVVLLTLLTGACSSTTNPISAISGNTIIVGFNPAQEACYDPTDGCQISLAEDERLGSDESVVIID